MISKITIQNKIPTDKFGIKFSNIIVEIFILAFKLLTLHTINTKTNHI